MADDGGTLVHVKCQEVVMILGSQVVGQPFALLRNQGELGSTIVAVLGHHPGIHNFLHFMNHVFGQLAVGKGFIELDSI